MFKADTNRHGDHLPFTCTPLYFAVVAIAVAILVAVSVFPASFGIRLGLELNRR